MDDRDDRRLPGELMSGDLVARAHCEHAIFRQPRHIADDRVVDLLLALASHHHQLPIVRTQRDDKRSSRRVADKVIKRRRLMRACPLLVEAGPWRIAEKAAVLCIIANSVA